MRASNLVPHKQQCELGTTQHVNRTKCVHNYIKNQRNCAAQRWSVVKFSKNTDSITWINDNAEWFRLERFLCALGSVVVDDCQCQSSQLWMFASINLCTLQLKLMLILVERLNVVTDRCILNDFCVNQLAIGILTHILLKMTLSREHLVDSCGMRALARWDNEPIWMNWAW